MKKLLDFGRKALMYVRILSGYEERRIRSHRLQLQQRLQRAQEKKAALNKVPEQIIIGEVRRMVEEMQSLNKKLEETEQAIDEYFKPLNKEAEYIIKTQLEGEERTMKEMLSTMQSEALMEQVEAERAARLQASKADEKTHESTSADNQAKAR